MIFVLFDPDHDGENLHVVGTYVQYKLTKMQKFPENKRATDISLNNVFTIQGLKYITLLKGPAITLISRQNFLLFGYCFYFLLSTYKSHASHLSHTSGKTNMQKIK